MLKILIEAIKIYLLNIYKNVELGERYRSQLKRINNK